MRKLSILAGLMVLSTSAFAATNNPDFINQQNLNSKVSNKAQIAKGIRLSLTQSNLELELQSDDLEFDSRDRDLDTNAQFSIGYTDIKVGEVGFMGEFSYLQIDTDADEGDVSNTRLSGNATYGLNQNVYAFGGLNISKYNVDNTSVYEEEFTYDYDAGVGYQLGLGAQVNKNLAIEVAYVSLRSSRSAIVEIGPDSEENDTFSSKILDLEADLLTRGIQINLVGTF